MRKLHWQMLLLGLVCALLLLATSVAYADTMAAKINWWTVDGGGGHSSSDHFSLNGAIGQPDAGYLSGENARLYGGFWMFGGEVGTGYQVFLPITNK
ncbi:MAG TPA: hypothetical protein PKM21_15425 [Anaerolineales bacterium]|nr:hypothetical protein [Anaerolineales bacterium]